MALVKTTALVLQEGTAGSAGRAYSKTCPPPLSPEQAAAEAQKAALLAENLAWVKKCLAHPFSFGCVGASTSGGGGNAGGGSGSATCTTPGSCSPQLSIGYDANGDAVTTVLVNGQPVGRYTTQRTGASV
jgi:hypothetical protein